MLNDGRLLRQVRLWGRRARRGHKSLDSSSYLLVAFPLSDPDGRTTHRSQEDELLLILSRIITEFTERFSGPQETINWNHLYSLGLFTTTKKRFFPFRGYYKLFPPSSPSLVGYVLFSELNASDKIPVKATIKRYNLRLTAKIWGANDKAESRNPMV